MTTVFHERSDGKTTYTDNFPERKKLHRTNQGSYFLGGNISNWNNVRAPIQFRTKRGIPLSFDDTFFQFFSE